MHLAIQRIGHESFFSKDIGMCNFFRGMIIVSIVFVLSGCYVGEFSIGNLSPSVTKHYEISGSSFDKAFEMACRSMEESDIEIYNLNKYAGKIDAKTNRNTDTFQDVRTITTNSHGFEFLLEQEKTKKLVFNIKYQLHSEKYINKFLDNYSKYINFTQIGPVEEAEGSEAKDYGNSNVSERIISEIRTGSSSLYEPRYEFSKEEIIHIQIFLNKLGYDPGPADGTMNSKTMAAIEKFKAENKIIKQLF